MKPLVPYLFFNGNCGEAMNFYQSCFGGNLEVKTYAEAPADDSSDCLEGANKDEVMHSFLTDGSYTLMASDWPKSEANLGNNVQLCINCESKEQIEKLFNALSDNGTIVQPLCDSFWGAHFGSLIDKFGIHWMLNYRVQQ